MNDGRFKKGFIPWNAGMKGKGICKTPPKCIKKGQHISKKTEFKKGGIPWNKGIKYTLILAEKHPNWKGDNVGYNALHSWIRRRFGLPNKCNKCGVSNKKLWYHLHNISGEYKRDLKDWEWLCAKCHIHIHKPWEARWGTC